jgi:hypothetical protein
MEEIGTDGWFKKLYGFGLIILMSYLILHLPGLAWLVGLAIGLTICWVIQYDEWSIRRETRNIDSEHERL